MVLKIQVALSSTLTWYFRQILRCPQKPERTVDNVEYFAEIRKKYGELADAGIPDEIKAILKAQGRW